VRWRRAVGAEAEGVSPAEGVLRRSAAGAENSTWREAERRPWKVYRDIRGKLYGCRIGLEALAELTAIYAE
jgi:hypothetical protein